MRQGAHACVWQTSDAIAALRMLGVEVGVATWTTDAVAALGRLGVEAGAAT